MPFTDRATFTRQVRRYLIGDFTEADGTPLTEARADEIIAKHPKELESGVRCGSNYSYVSDKIGSAEEGLMYTGLLSDKEEADALKREQEDDDE